MGRIIDASEVLLELGLASSVTEEERAIVTTAIRRAESSVIRHLRYDPVKQERTEFYPQNSTNLIVEQRILESNATVAYERNLSQGATDELPLRHLPIRSISNLYIDYDAKSGSKAGSFAAESEKIEGTDFWANYDLVDSDGNKVCSDGILRSIGIWPLEPGTVKVVYTAGWTPEELHGQDGIIDAGAIADAVILEAVRKAKRSFTMKKKTQTGFTPGLFTSERAGDYSYTISDKSADKELQLGSGLSSDAIEMLSEFVNWGF